jgi:lysophospholipase L1-like esterase
MSRRAVLLVVVAAVFFSLGVLLRPALSRLKHRLATPAASGDFRVFDLSHYTAKSSHFATLPKARPVVLLGDSRVAGAEWSELLERGEISNRGISGDTTSGVLRRLETSVPAGAALCVLQVGVNDLILGGSIEQTVANYRQIVGWLQKERNARVVITSVIPASEEQPELNRAIHELNQQLVQLAAASGAQWVDLGPALSPEGFLRAELRSDAVHLNGDGYLRFRDALTPVLQ